jgi:phosphoribosyl-ATP pyrophosphohydrolase
MKGENSGNTLKLLRLRADCDRDALLATVDASGPVCHTGAWSCFGVNRNFSWEYLQSVIADRFRNPVPGSYTATLDDELVREKIMEEAEELCNAKTRDEKIWEAADLLYFATALMTLEEIETLAGLNCDVQLGMALYTGNINLADAFISSLNWKKAAQTTAGGVSSAAGNALLPLIAQSSDGQVLMTGFAGREALAESFSRGNLCFHSRTRNKLWMKGENSGNILKLLRLRADCDRDALLATVDAAGPVCHTGFWSCFGVNQSFTWKYLQKIIAERFSNPVPSSYTATLDDELVREKIMEEAEELCTAKTRDEKIWEAADLLYFATALITREGITVADVLNELTRRHNK